MANLHNWRLTTASAPLSPPGTDLRLPRGLSSSWNLPAHPTRRETGQRAIRGINRPRDLGLAKGPIVAGHQTHREINQLKYIWATALAIHPRRLKSPAIGRPGRKARDWTPVAIMIQ